MPSYTKTDVSTSKRMLLAFTGDNTDPIPTFNTVVTGRTLNGFKQSGWRHKVKRHISATTNLSASKTEVSDVPGSCYAVGYVPGSRSTPNRWFTQIGGPHNGVVTPKLLGTVDPGTAISTAAGAYYRKARNAMSTFKGSVFAAESREAKRMMFDRASKMLNSIGPYQNRLRKRWYGRGSKRARLKALSDSWLELQFGWLPLISDVEDALTALNEPRPQYKRISGSGSHSKIINRSNGIGAIGIGQFLYTETETTSYKIKYYGEVRAYRDPAGAGFRQDFGFHVREFLPTAYEVLPWSFAVDYFTNVGEIITAASYASCDFTWNAQVTHSERVLERTTSWGAIPNSSGNRYETKTSSAAVSRGTSSTVNRSAIGRPEIPGLRWQLPNWKQGLNLAALAVSKRLKLFHDK